MKLDVLIRFSYQLHLATDGPRSLHAQFPTAAYVGSPNHLPFFSLGTYSEFSEAQSSEPVTQTPQPWKCSSLNSIFEAASKCSLDPVENPQYSLHEYCIDRLFSCTNCMILVISEKLDANTLRHLKGAKENNALLCRALRSNTSRHILLPHS